MKCICGNVLTGRQREFCSDKCRKRASRTKSTPEDGLQSTNADTPVLMNPDNPERGHPHRPAIPGDADYVGVCKLVDGEWVVKPDPPVPTEDLSDAELQIRLKSYRSTGWVSCSEHKEVLRRKRVAQAGAAV